MKYNTTFNGVYTAKNNTFSYLVYFNFGESKQGIQFKSLKSKVPEKYFDISAFTPSSNYNYEIASEQDELWLKACIHAEKLVERPALSNQFSEGDIVECISPDYMTLVGNKYTVSEGNFEYNVGYDCIRLVENRRSAYKASDFVIHKRAPKKEFIPLIFN